MTNSIFFINLFVRTVFDLFIAFVSLNALSFDYDKSELIVNYVLLLSKFASSHSTVAR
jgi:hypothetical protein